ncbi:beta-hydroxyacyl-ACP dehydratase [Botrimarina hoheduenensis]|uniref:3-hydroxyacyl-[acyl-carrier-protein] dehydratase FabZ n=1 Tax=Botrimarina hoheduenensis TaxID=2528000 RepID=A0A5C5W975_9BACT|nr:beta-hydroxyacyl-ACP dehydratase [Botrimarina hoheduenensis]TWT46833.1 3-hydroxyacyl-[acyl-carrier-protein] dehydratase FabZ [Botrimarina hoheduenensis]
MRWFWVDRFTEYVAGSHATGMKGVSLSDELVHDHWDIYPTMPNTLIAEGMAQTAGLLVSELYQFQELVVLAKFTKLTFSGLARPGDALRYEARIGRTVDAGAQCTVTGTVLGSGGRPDRPQAEAEIFFARVGSDAPESIAGTKPARLFDPAMLVRWLHTTGVFTVGVRADGERMKPQDYGLPVKV